MVMGPIHTSFTTERASHQMLHCVESHICVSNILEVPDRKAGGDLIGKGKYIPILSIHAHEDELLTLPCYKGPNYSTYTEYVVVLLKK